MKFCKYVNQQVSHLDSFATGYGNSLLYVSGGQKSEEVFQVSSFETEKTFLLRIFVVRGQNGQKYTVTNSRILL